MLAHQGIENYCPLQKTTRQWSDRKKTVLLPVFKSYVFVHSSKSQYRIIRDTAGVVNFVYWLGTPAIVKDSEIETIKMFISRHDNITVGQTKVNLNDTVRIMEGALSMKEGRVIGIKNQTVKVSLPSLGCVLVAEVTKLNINVMNGQNAFCPSTLPDNRPA